MPGCYFWKSKGLPSQSLLDGRQCLTSLSVALVGGILWPSVSTEEIRVRVTSGTDSCQVHSGGTGSQFSWSEIRLHPSGPGG